MVNGENQKMSQNPKKVDPRHQERKKAIKSLFAYSFDEKGKRKETSPANLLAKKVLGKIKTIDKAITKSAPKWPLEKVNRVDLAILRLASWELLYRSKVPPKVIINEAIELGKEYGGETSPGFINGVLGTVYKDLESKKEKKEEDGKSKTAGKKTKN